MVPKSKLNPLVSEVSFSMAPGHASSNAGMPSNKKKRKSLGSSEKHQFTFEQEMDAQFDRPGKKRHGKVRKQQEREEVYEFPCFLGSVVGVLKFSRSELAVGIDVFNN
jgi:hypothetical protein